MTETTGISIFRSFDFNNAKLQIMKMATGQELLKVGNRFVRVHTVPFAQGKVLYERLQEKGCDAALLELTGAEHADIRFFQQEVWDEIISFFREKLS